VMISVDMGIEAELNSGFPAAAAAGGAVRQAPAADIGLTGRSNQAAAGPLTAASFKDALRAAAGTDRPNGAASRPPPAQKALLVRNYAEQAHEAGALPSDDPAVDGNSNEPLVGIQALGFLLSICMPAPTPMQAGLQAGECAPSAAADAAAEIQNGAEKIPKEWSEWLNRLIRLGQSQAVDSAEHAVLMSRLAELIEQHQTLSGGASAARVPENFGDLMQKVGEALSAAKWALTADAGGRMVAQTLEAIDGGGGRVPSGLETPVDVTAQRTIEAADILAAVRRVMVQVREGNGTPPNAQPATAPGEVSSAPVGNVPDLASMPRAADLTTTHPAALRATHPQEVARASAAPESGRSGETVSDSGAPVREGCQAVSAELGDFRQAADDLFSPKMPATATWASGEGEALPEDLVAMPREARLSTPAEANMEKGIDGPLASRDKETGRAGVFEQIVQRAAVQLKNDQGEINIDLKPDFLGRVRMQILTENQQVTVRIVTELAAVRDMIETGLHQLKSVLQSQGLQVERLEVAVADDHRQQDWQQAHTAQAWKAAAAGEVSADGHRLTEDRSEPFYYRPRSDGRATIDMFV